MYVPGCLGDRVDEARSAARFGKVIRWNTYRSVCVVHIPGHNAKMHQVILNRYKTGFSATCRVDAGPLGYVPCQGNTHGVCYHSIAAFLLISEKAGYEVRVSDEIAGVKRLACFYKTRDDVVDGSVVVKELRSKQCQYAVLGVLLYQDKEE